MFKTILSLILALLLGYSLTHLPFEIFHFRWEIWAAIALLSAIVIIIFLYQLRTQDEKMIFPMPSHENGELHQFQHEFKCALRGHLKISILFWSYYYKKEKVKTFEEAKKDVFQDLKREFQNLRWMESILEEIRQELVRYK